MDKLSIKQDEMEEFLIEMKMGILILQIIVI